VTGGNEQKRKHAEWVKIKRDNEESAAARGEDLSKPEMYESAEQAEQRAKKQKKKEKNKASFGWEVFNQDNLFRAYKKRADGAFGGTESEKADYSALKHSYAATGGNFYPSANDMDYGAQSEAGSLAQAIPEANIARMVNELDDAAARRKNFSRRRAHNDDRDVDSINERNAVFNRKVGRAFDKYTVEIRQNLERGTALPN
jgi:pre-mRNA-splicing factor SYF2